MTTAAQYAQVALSHLGEPGPDNTCLSNGVQKWAGECGLPQLGNNTPTVPVYRTAAKQLGYYHSGTDGLTVGDVCDWAFLNGIIGHVSVCTQHDSKGITSVASGTSKGVISLSTVQPVAIQGYIRLPFGNESSLTVAPASDPTVSSAVSGLSGVFPGLVTIAETVGQPQFWERFGLFALGSLLVLLALIVSLKDSSVGSAVKSGIQQVSDLASA